MRMRRVALSLSPGDGRRTERSPGHLLNKDKNDNTHPEIPDFIRRQRRSCGYRHYYSTAHILYHVRACAPRERRSGAL
ncbi:hypothetical protein EVAR_20433_1 [Eumeta japonica]|uniref:Uncharacterized protein n=1 Tax=Eumeta variegata TaxID=151549 RepID=A0A4C1TXW5_EUMVA|nr:hypothetical protein EVAR_20433_1 [Eumeta japonica]